MTNLNVAPPILRFCAYAFDNVLIFLLVSVLASIMGLSLFMITVIDLVVKIAYFSYFAARPRGSTIGQMICSLQVVKTDGRLLTFMESFDRIVIQLFLPLLILISAKVSTLAGLVHHPIVILIQFIISVLIMMSYLIALFSNENRTIYDIMSECIVIKK